jgi:hypothetical protein
MLANIHIFKLVEITQKTIHNYSVMFRFQNCHTFVREWSPSNASATLYTTFYVHTFVCSDLEGYSTSWYHVVQMSIWLPKIYSMLLPSPSG